MGEQAGEQADHLKITAAEFVLGDAQQPVGVDLLTGEIGDQGRVQGVEGARAVGCIGERAENGLGGFRPAGAGFGPGDQHGAQQVEQALVLQGGEAGFGLHPVAGAGGVVGLDQQGGLILRQGAGEAGGLRRVGEQVGQEGLLA